MFISHYLREHVVNSHGCRIRQGIIAIIIVRKTEIVTELIASSTHLI